MKTLPKKIYHVGDILFRKNCETKNYDEFFTENSHFMSDDRYILRDQSPIYSKDQTIKLLIDEILIILHPDGNT